MDLPLTMGPRLARSASVEAQQRGLAVWARSLLAAAGVRVVVEGIEHLRRGGPFVLASLHESFVDVPVLATLPMPLRFTARQELFEDPHLGPLLSASAHVPIAEARTRDAMRRLLRSLSDVAARGESIVVFPQGSLLGVEIAFQRGFWRVPRRLGLPVLPVTIAGSHLVWGYPLDGEVRFGRTVTVVIHEPIPAHAWSAERARETERMLKATALSIGTARRYVPERDGWWDGYTFDIDPDFPDLADAVAAHRRT